MKEDELKNKTLPMVLGILAFLLALLITLYPVISNYVNERYASEIHTAYEEIIQQADNSSLLEAKKQAIAYNEAITPGTAGEAYSQAALTDASRDYESQLNIAGDGTMGYVEIPKISVNLPIYHGTGNDSLERGVGHLLGSSLPVGGASTHAILTGHSGMATQKMFTDLEQLSVGDVFYLHILDETLAYQVDRIKTVLPYDTSLLGITSGRDYCTLVTCTPYGINTHRLLVRGTRIAYEEAEVIVEETAQEEQQQSRWVQLPLAAVFDVNGALFNVFVKRQIQYARFGNSSQYTKGGACHKQNDRQQKQYGFENLILGLFFHSRYSSFHRIIMESPSASLMALIASSVKWFASTVN